MKEITSYIHKKYGILLSQSEVEDLLKWFNSNSEIINNEHILDKKLGEYLYDKYKSRPIYLVEEDLSNLNYLLSLLKKEIKSK